MNIEYMNTMTFAFKHSLRLWGYKALAILSMLTFAIYSGAQTPIANRVKAMADNLPKECRVVAKYTDDKRHCLYYSMNNRLYKYDVLTNKNHEVKFSTNSYSKILNTYIVDKGRYIYLCVEKDLHPKRSPENIRELWQINTIDMASKKVGSGYNIEKRKGCFIIKKTSRRMVGKATGMDKWMVRDHYYDLDGHIIWAKNEYEYR